jgi:hypothetical protein
MDYTIRCPYCLCEKAVPQDIAVDKSLKCKECSRTYEFQNALPAAGDAAPQSVAPELHMRSHEDRLQRVLIVGGIAVFLCVWCLSIYASDLDGPSFLMLYLFSGIAGLLISNVVRWNYMDSFFVSTLAAVFFVLLGVLRYIDATAQGMSNFSAIWIMMVIGVVFYFVRSDTSGSKNKTTFFGCCGAGCGSSCGGGCGGGCGGCGG